ncbi:hypothetical protein T439DRAFT_379461 [Meredithblackwellia eburnea MCA 4105]
MAEPSPGATLSLLSGLANTQWTAHSPSTDHDGLPEQYFKRQLGVLEVKFDRAAKGEGMSDTFLRLKIDLGLDHADLNGVARDEMTTMHGAKRTFLARLPLVWASLRRRHPTLASTVHDLEETEHWRWKHPPNPREFHYSPPRDELAALDDARRTILSEELEELEDVIESKVLNGPRVLLDQAQCLARLIVFNSKDEPSKLSLMLVIAHTISDGLSIFSLMREFFDILSDSSLPTPPTPPPYLTLKTFLSTRDPVLPTWEIPPQLLRAWSIIPPVNTNFPSILPPSSESVYLSHLPGATASSLGFASSTVTHTHDLSRRELARQRWFWAISRALILVRNERYPRTRMLPRIERQGPFPQAHSQWKPMKFDQGTTAKLIALCKEKKISPSMLSYAIMSIAVSNIISRVDPDAPYQPVLFGFPMSLRRVLVPLNPVTSADMAIRITFSTIHLPKSPHSLTKPTAEEREWIRWTAVQNARLAARQFADKFDPEEGKRKEFFSTGYYLIMDRLLNSHGMNTFPLNEPRGVLNSSMVGDLDRILPTNFELPGSQSLRLTDALLGTRLHRGEGMLMEAFTWNKQLTFCLGYDDQVVEAALVDEILSQIEEIGKVIVL